MRECSTLKTSASSFSGQCNSRNWSEKSRYKTTDSRRRCVSMTERYTFAHCFKRARENNFPNSSLYRNEICKYARRKVENSLLLNDTTFIFLAHKFALVQTLKSRENHVMYHRQAHICHHHYELVYARPISIPESQVCCTAVVMNKKNKYETGTSWYIQWQWCTAIRRIKLFRYTSLHLYQLPQSFACSCIRPNSMVHSLLLFLRFG